MSAASIAGFAFAGPYAAAIVSGGCALVLWGTVAAIVSYQQRSGTAS